MTDIIIAAPLNGWVAPLEEVPDPVFAHRMMGDGIALHPTGSVLHAPCDGLVIALHAAGHAVTIEHASGAQILVHIGLDTVAMGGRGFRAQVAVGDAVTRGDALIGFNLDLVARTATSAVTPVIVVNSDAFRILHARHPGEVATGDTLFALHPVTSAPPIDTGDLASEDEGGSRRVVVIPLAHGLHARPAARIAACARPFDAEVAILHADRRANARSAVAVMGLALRRGDSITIVARGPDAQGVCDAVAELITSGMGEAPEPARRNAGALVPPVDAPAGALAGVAAAPGMAIGPAHWLDASTPEIAPDAADPAAERSALDAGVALARDRVAKAAATGAEAQRSILAAHLAFLEDVELLASAYRHVAAGRSAGFAWSEAIAAQREILLGTGDARFAERAADLADIRRQVLLAMGGDGEPSTRSTPPGAILLAEDILPSQVAALTPGSVGGIVLIRGGATSHAAIIAGSIGVPMVVATGDKLRQVADSTAVALDAPAGLVHIAPDAGFVAHFHDRMAHADSRRNEALASAQDACHAVDGHRIEILANCGTVADAEFAAAQGADGSGLVRTEFLFLDRREAPDEEEQFANYQAIAAALSGRPVTVRLLDIGGDKPAPYLPLAHEANPMLGLRGIRATLAHPALLDTQLRAILRVQPAGQCRIMVPMVTGAHELRAVREAANRAADDLGLGATPRIGAMIETPAAAVTADLIAAEADFLSIGTNDLTQYTLAMDRENPALAVQVDALHPAVLRLVGQACQAGARFRRPVGVCGGLASDPLGVPILLGLGANELSVVPAFIPEAKALVRRLDLSACRDLANRARLLASAGEVRALARAFIEELN